MFTNIQLRSLVKYLCQQEYIPEVTQVVPNLKACKIYFALCNEFVSTFSKRIVLISM